MGLNSLLPKLCTLHYSTSMPARRAENKGCDGGHPYYVYSYLKDLTVQRGFLARDNCYPYSSGISLAVSTKPNSESLCDQWRSRTIINCSIMQMKYRFFVHVTAWSKINLINKLINLNSINKLQICNMQTGTCKVPTSNLSCAGIQVKGFSWLDNEDDMQYALANIGPVVVLMDVSQSSFQYYKCATITCL